MHWHSARRRAEQVREYYNESSRAHALILFQFKCNNCSGAWRIRVRLAECDQFMNAVVHMLDQRRLNPSVQDLHIDGCEQRAGDDREPQAPVLPAQGCLPPKQLIGSLIPTIVPPPEQLPPPASTYALLYALIIILVWLVAHALGIKWLLHHVQKMIATHINSMIVNDLQHQMQPLQQQQQQNENV